MNIILRRFCIAVALWGLACPLGWCADTETESGDGRLAADEPVGASDEGELAMSSFRKPQGWDVSLFASEPDLANPVALHVDNQGRVFVCESFRQDRGVTDNRKHDRQWLLADLAAQSVQDRIAYHRRLLGEDSAGYTAHDDRIRLLEDTDGDGVADRATMFAEGFNQLEDGTGAGVLVRGNQAYYTCIPKLWLLSDEDGDGRADARRVLHDGYGVRVAFRGHDLHGLIIGPDGRLYFSIGDRGYNVETKEGTLQDAESGAVFRCELDGSRLEVFATGLRNPQELAFDDFGYLFTGDNNSDSGDKARWVNVMEGGDSGWRMMYQYLPDRGPFNREKIWEPYFEETPAYIVPPIANIGDGPSGLTCYPGTGLSGDYANCFFMVDFRGGASNSGVRLIRTQPEGAFWKLERSEQPLWNILATDVDFGPDGALWICDWGNGWVGEGKGRIYRFADTTAGQQEIVKEVQQLLQEGFATLDGARLGELLRHADRRIRLEAQWELATRGELREFVNVVADSSAGVIARIHGVWGLGQAARLTPDLRATVTAPLAAALDDADGNVRASAAAVVGDLGLETLSDKMVALIGDAEPRVQYAACIASGKMHLRAALEPTCEMLTRNRDIDPALRHAGIMMLSGLDDPALVEALKDHRSRSVRIAAVVALRKLADLRIAGFLADPDAGVRLEAGRAIHDVPQLHAALPQLAALAGSPIEDEALARRVLNANFRLAGNSAVAAVATLAVDSDRSDATRAEAIEMLGTWGEPGELDRVMNRYQPLAGRDQATARKALEARFAGLLGGSPLLQAKAIQAAVSLELRGTCDSLRAFVQQESHQAQLRSEALAGLVSLGDRQTRPLVASLAEGDISPVVQAQAMLLLADLDPENALPLLAKAVSADDRRVRQAAWDAVAGIDLPAATTLIEDGLKRYLADKLPPDVWLNVIEAAEGQVSSESIAALNRFESSRRAADSLEAYRDCMFGGDVEAGRELFFNKTELSCVRCHRVGETGGEVGPVLTEIGKTKDHRYLLESIVDPDAKIAENYETIILLTEDDKIITGILRNQTPDQIELMDAEGKIIQIDPAEVVLRKKGKSAMPIDLLKSLSRRELRDLVAYLASLGKDS